ncbi:MAG: glycosyltransferase family 2 protein [Anaerolineales bacterium]|nr:glycosyltransferase family 2 protein [Anaerolineales bacterium]
MKTTKRPNSKNEDVFLSIIIPAYNEESRLPETMERINTFLSSQKFSYEVVIVENGSTDNTLRIAAEFAERHPGFAVVHSEIKGKGRAIQTGILTAVGKYRFMCDADSSMPIEEVLRFLPPQMDHDMDIVIGSREATGAVRYGESNYRHIGGRLVNYMIQLLAIQGIDDTQCGYKMFKASVAEDIFSVLTVFGWSFDIEVLYIAKLRGYKFVELPIPWYFSEMSHVSPVRDTFRMVFDILKIHINRLKGYYGT